MIEINRQEACRKEIHQIHVTATVYFLRIQKLRDGFLVFFRLNVAALKVVKMNKNAIESRRGLCSMLCT